MTENDEAQDAPLMTYALWGAGDITPENAKALLDEYIPDNVGTVYRPERMSDTTRRSHRDYKGLRVVLDWFESPDFLGEGGAVPSTDLIQSLIDDRDGEFHDDVYLLALWPSAPTHEDFDFIERAVRENIIVIDLARAWDELDLSLYTRPEPTKEEKAEAKEEVKRGRGRPKKLSDSAEAQDAGVVVPPPETADVDVARVIPETSLDKITPASSLHERDMQDVEYALEFAKTSLMAAIDTYVEAKMNFMRFQSAASDESAPEQDMTRPPFDPPYVGVDTKPYYWRKSANTFRKADGKPRRGEAVINLTDAEAVEKGISLD